MTNTVAQTILAQLGGGRFLLMTGAKNLMSAPNALQFDLPKAFAKGGVNKCRVILDASDTYTVKTYKYNSRTLECPEVDSRSEVYADRLQQVFRDMTGLDTSI